MNAKPFKAYGVLVLVLDLLGVSTWLPEIAWTGGFSVQQKTIRMLVAFVAVAVVGFGLLHLRRWAAIYFSVPLFCYGVWIAWSAIEQVTFPWNLLYMLQGISFMLPAIVTVRLWPYLTWGRRFF